jgi:threonine dehydratase
MTEQPSHSLLCSGASRGFEFECRAEFAEQRIHLIARALGVFLEILSTTAATDTAADTIAVRVPVPQALREMRTAVDDLVLIGEDRLHDAVRRLHRELGLVVEPSGAASLAAAIRVGSYHRDRLVAIIISGGNLAPALIPSWL